VKFPGPTRQISPSLSGAEGACRVSVNPRWEGHKSATTGLLHRSESDQRSFGYMATADTLTPTLQLLFLVCGTSGNDNTAPTVATSLAMPGCQSRHCGE
jgi:hypothetical protein